MRHVVGIEYGAGNKRILLNHQRNGNCFNSHAYQLKEGIQHWQTACPSPTLIDLLIRWMMVWEELKAAGAGTLE